jgi:hypothetical protein
MLPEKTTSRRCLAPSPELTQSKSVEPPAQHPPTAVQPALPQAIQRPCPDDWPTGHDRGGGPRSRSQILMAGCPRHEHRSSCYWNLATSSLTTSTRKVLLGERPSADSMAKDTAARSVASPPTIFSMVKGHMAHPVMRTSILWLQSFLPLRYLALSHDHEHNN